MIQAAIVAGGLGTRMHSVDAQTPKFMLPVGGKPLLEHQILWLKSSGIREIFLCLGHKAQTVVDYFGDGSKWGVRLDYQIENSARGTAGAVRDLSSKLRGDLLVVYGDLYVAMDCGKLLAFHEERPGDATLVVSPTDHPLDSDMVKTEGERITGFFRPRPGDAFENIAAAAIWIVRPSLLELVPTDVPSDFGRLIFPRALAAGRTLNAYRTSEQVEDVGTPERRENLLRRLSALPQSE